MGNNSRGTIRSEMKRIVSNLDEGWIAEASQALCAELSEIIEKRLNREIKRVLAWTSFFPGEVDLTRFISQQVEQREVYLPRSLPDRTMTYISIGKNWTSSFQAGLNGIPEPSDSSGKLYDPNGDGVDAGADTVVVTPGLAFDRLGNRLGRGKGYYDRFLGRADLKNACRIGVLWGLQLVERVPAEPHDVPMHWLCHEEGAVHTDLDYDEHFAE